MVIMRNLAGLRPFMQLIIYPHCSSVSLLSSLKVPACFHDIAFTFYNTPTLDENRVAAHPKWLPVVGVASCEVLRHHFLEFARGENVCKRRDFKVLEIDIRK